MSQPYHPLVHPSSDQSAQHQEATGVKDNPLYNAWKILAQVHATLTATQYNARHSPLDTRNSQLGEEVWQLGDTVADLAKRRDMASAYYARDDYPPWRCYL